jgi:hypothetical protein
VKMRRQMVHVEHRDHDSIELSDARHVVVPVSHRPRLQEFQRQRVRVEPRLHS